MDKLEDQFEGSGSKLSAKNLEKLFHKTSQNFKRPLSQTEITGKVNETLDFIKGTKPNTCINCWNVYETESAALWKIYSDFGKGIMIKSSVSRLETALSEATQTVRMSLVNYIDYDHDVIDLNDLRNLHISKQKAYQYEQEIRLLHWVNDLLEPFDWTNEEIQGGIYIKTTVPEMIEEVIVGPYSPSWFTGLIRNVLEKYGLNIPVIRSRLSLVE
jgi:hypothetical protein